MRRGILWTAVPALASVAATVGVGTILTGTTTTTVASAATGTVQLSLKPDRVSAHSALSVNANGPFPSVNGQPRSASVRIQKGFASSAKSVPVLCTTSQANANACPAKSKIGSGYATVTAFNAQDTITLTLFLGVRQRVGDIASVVIVGTDSIFGQTAHGSGRLLATSRGLELLFNKLPNFQVPAGTSITLDQLKLTAHAVRTVGAHTHSLITNPPTCTGHWSGSVKLTFSSGSYSRQLSAPCRSH